MRKTVSASLTLVVFGLAFAAPASAKILGPFRVVTPSGRVAWVRGADAKAWWHDELINQPGDCGCRSPESTARFVQKLAKKWTRWPSPLLIVPAGHAAPMLYYAANGNAPPYVVAPGGLADSGPVHAWDDWRVVTPRMQRIVTAALHKSDSGFPTGWVVGGVLGALALVVIVLAAPRRSLPRGLTRLASSLLP